MRKTHGLLATALAFSVLFLFTAEVSAQSVATPKNLVLQSNGKFEPAPGYVWLTNDVKDLRVRWSVGIRHPQYPNTLASTTEGIWVPAAGYRWMTNDVKDLRVVQSGPSDEQIARAVLKALGALALHEAGKPQANDGFIEDLARAASRKGRDSLIESAVQDLAPTTSPLERVAVRQLAVLALEGRLDRNRNNVIAQLRRTNPDMANAVEIAEFLIRLAHAIDQSRR